jgi:uncharacterized membrane protein YkvA (DUF1232 family)
MEDSRPIVNSSQPRDLDERGWLQSAKQRARAVKRDAVAVWIAARDPRVPWYAKVVAVSVAAYALSPIDLIPDFIPILGYVDDLLIVPAGILLTIRLIPAGLMDEFREEAARYEQRPISMAGASGIILLWLGALALTAWWLRHYWSTWR